MVSQTEFFNEGAVKLIQSVIPSKSAEDISRDFIRAMDYPQ